jgi:hypothetical protein
LTIPPAMETMPEPLTLTMEPATSALAGVSVTDEPPAERPTCCLPVPVMFAPSRITSPLLVTDEFASSKT